jgi:UDP-N-acetyl-alpha-D-muramoyl-L-alanyl-L-glutamate epimerase
LTEACSTVKICTRQGSSVVEHFIHNEAVMGSNPILGTSSMKFIFKGYDSNLKKGEVLFHFSFKGEENIDFTERISFPPVAKEISETLLKSLLNNLMLILGISYWKLYCPKEIIVESNFLTQKQAEFWNTVYTKGLGEFFYKNKINFHGLVKFPFNEKAISAPMNFPRQNRFLVGIGGGKDSIVVAELLRKDNKEFDLTTAGFPIQIEIARAIGGKVINVFRQIDPKLLKLNKQKGAYNGHVPISVYYAFLLVFLAAIFDYKHVVIGNEKSANYGNVEYLGEMINHQWSKSLEFERLFQDYVKKYITQDIIYYSPLREMAELEVVKEFVRYPKYFNIFSSCNKNYKINPLISLKTKWCGECPKCLFIFICLAAFLSKEKLISIFGKNLFEDANLIPLFGELIGIRNFKPFECVGTAEEVKEALEIVFNKKEFKKDLIIKHYETIRIK